jgi:glycosyltransferase involved in cell wall biosynthesis
MNAVYVTGERTSEQLALATGLRPPAPKIERRAPVSLGIIVPVYNEQYLIGASLSRLAILSESPLIHRISVVVVDDGSTDKTPAAIEAFRATANDDRNRKLSWLFLRHEKNGGKGAAIRTALAHIETDLVVIHDADLEYHPRDLLQMVEVFIYEDADAVFGSRFMPGGHKRALLFRHAMGNKLLTFLCDLVCDLNLTDMETCYKMVRTDLLKSIPLESATFDVEPELAIKLARRGSRIFEVPISYSGRTYGEGKKITWKDGCRALRAIQHYAITKKLYTSGCETEPPNSAHRIRRWMASIVQPFVGQRVLEIQAGVGNMSIHLMPRAVYWTTDINPHCVDYLVSMSTTRPYMHVMQTNPSIGETYPSGQVFDTVLYLNPPGREIEDIGTLRNMWRVLDPGGRAIVTVPRLSRQHAAHNEADQPRRHAERRLIDNSGRAGFRVEQVIRMNRCVFWGWWLKQRILRRRKSGVFQIRLLDLLTHILPYFDPWVPVRALSAIAVLRKEETPLDHA